MDDIPALVEAFFTASATGKATADKFRDLLPKSISFLLSLGLGLDDIPTDEHITQLDTYLKTVPNRMGKTYSPSTIGDWKRITKDFFTYRNKTKGDLLMSDTEYDINNTAWSIPDTAYDIEPVRTANYTEQYNSATTAETLPQPDEDNDTEKRRAGRPIKGDEGRDKKITVNIPLSIFNDIKDMANIDGVTFPDCINEILAQAVQDRESDIKEIRKLRANKSRKH